MHEKRSPYEQDDRWIIHDGSHEMFRFHWIYVSRTSIGQNCLAFRLVLGDPYLGIVRFLLFRVSRSWRDHMTLHARSHDVASVSGLWPRERIKQFYVWSDEIKMSWSTNSKLPCNKSVSWRSTEYILIESVARKCGVIIGGSPGSTSSLWARYWRARKSLGVHSARMLNVLRVIERSRFFFELRLVHGYGCWGVLT